MKKLIYSLLIISILSLLFTACKKKEVELTTAEKVHGTWQLQTDIYHEMVGGVEFSDTTKGSGESVEFRGNGYAYSNYQGQTDSSAYTITGDTQITLEGTGTFTIKSLTGNSFVLYMKESSGADFYEETISLAK